MSNLGSISAVLFFVLAVNVSIAQQEKSTLIRYATVHVGNGEVIDNAYVVFHGSEISRVSDANKSRINPSDYDTIIDADGKHLYPGFILMDSRIGLIEIDQVKATHDFRETGKFLPNVRALPEITDEPAKMWGASIVGYGSYRYKYKTGREGDWFLTGFSPRKQSLTLYIMSGFKRYDELLNQLGKHKTGVSCLYIKRLSDVDADILKTLIKESVDYMRSIDQTKVTDE